MKRLAPAILPLALLSSIGCGDDLVAPGVAPDGLHALMAPTAHNHAPFWERDLDNPANGDVQLYAGEGMDPLDLVWDIKGGTASQATAGGVLDPLLVIDDYVMRDLAGNVVCTVEKVDGHGAEHFLLRDAVGTVLLTQWHRYTFGFEKTVPPLASPDSPSLLQDGVLLSFKHDQVFFGRWPDGQVAVTASARIEQANPMRKMLVAALVAGHCGSSGLLPS
jgi:hypothetical protein